MAARLVFRDRKGRPRVVADLRHRQGGAIGLSLRVLDREGAPRLVGALSIRRDGTGELAVVVLDRRGMARAAAAFFIREHGAVAFVGVHRAGVRRLVVIAIRRPAAVPALPSAADMREVFGIGVPERPQPIRPLRAAGLALPRADTNPNRGGDGGGLIQDVELIIDGWLLRLLHPLLNAAVVHLDGPPRFPLGGALVVHDGLPVFLVVATVAVGNGGILIAAAHRDGRGELAAVMLDRRGTARVASVFFFSEDGALVAFHRAGVRRLIVIRPGAVPALPSTADMRELFGIGVPERPQLLCPLRAAGLALHRADTNPNRGGGGGGGGLLPDVEFIFDGWLLPLLHPLLNAAVVRLDGPPRFPLGAALVVHDGLPVFLFVAAVAIGNGGIRLLVLIVAAHRDGRGELAVVMLNRRGTARVASVFFFSEDGALVAFDRAGVRRLIVIRPAAVPALPSPADMRQVFGIGVPERPHPLRPLQAAGLALPRPDINRGGGGLLQGAELPLDGWLLRAAAASFVGPHLLLHPAATQVPSVPLLAAAPGVDDMLRFLTAPADGLDWRRRFRLIDAALAGLGAPPRLPLMDAAELGLDLDRRLLLPSPGPRLGIGRHPRDGSSQAAPVRHPIDAETLQLLEEGRLGRQDDAEILHSMLSHLVDEMHRETVSESTVTNAAFNLITELLRPMSETTRRHIIQAFAPVNHNPQQQNTQGRMLRSLLTTVGLSITSNMILYLLSAGIKKLDHEEASKQCAASTSPEQQKNDGWVFSFIAWMVEKIAAPVLLTTLVIWVRQNIIDNEIHLMQYDNNERANFLINGLSRGFFFATRALPGISRPDLWARLASIFVDLIGAAFLYWMGGFWDPDIPDAT